MPGDRTATWWAIYPQQCRRVFIQAFTAGLHDASLNGRVIEGTWRRTLLSLHDSVSSCPSCGAAVFYDPEQPGSPAGTARPRCRPAAAEAPGEPLVLSEGAV